MTNRGVVPLNPSTSTGQLRLLIGDTDYVDLVPVEPGFGDYNNFSDAELDTFVTSAGGSLTRASGYAYLRLAALSAAGAISWRSDDLAVDSKIPASEYRLLARIAFEQADNEDALGASAFALDFPFTTPDSIYGGQELAWSSNPWAAPTTSTDDYLDGGQI